MGIGPMPESELSLTMNAFRESPREMPWRLARIGYRDRDLVALHRLTLSPEACDIAGLPADTVLSDAEFQALLHPDDRESIKECWLQPCKKVVMRPNIGLSGLIVRSDFYMHGMS